MMYARLTAQTLTADTLAELRCANILILPPNSCEFDIILVNRSRPASQTASGSDGISWQYWANGTFYLTLHNVPRSLLQNARCELDSTPLPRLVFPHILGSERRAYEVKMQVQAAESRIAIAILGTDSVQNSFVVPQGMERLLGRFRLQFSDTVRSPEQFRMEWTEPYGRFQANAFKSVANNLYAQGTIGNLELVRHDNVEMLTAYRTEIPSIEPAPQLAVSTFAAEYTGDKRVRISWRTSSERTGRRTNAGFVVLRRIVSAESIALMVSDSASLLKLFALRPFDTLAHFRTNPALRLRGNAQGTLYELRDSAPSRGDVHFYRLRPFDANASAFRALQANFVKDSAFVRVPNTVLKFARAEPNPFVQNSTIRYELEDRARVSAELLDATGRTITRLAENLEQPRGVHTLALDASNIAVQGALFLALTAIPFDDAALERSETLLKLQRIR
ncbi:MAG: hypothetical protein EAZ92_03990 [Candidatus Kapaibacterium sp.]|nr:MAG: hypothetical protein EAZ92_03990 [Candidatus Kapabacteria bacterium]